MVVIYDTDYPKENKINDTEKYNFELDHFQKYALQTINEDKHVLITAHTGSGKTLPAEYAIEKYFKMGKKVIYTAPIKSLSNQKFNEFTLKYPHISFGILTGDIKFNPEADCLIMTTEILRNTLFQRQMKDNENIENILHFHMDIENELGCVIFDEIHYINDEYRGKVWEESIMMLPKQVKMVMLSATIDNVETFANWVEKTTNREVCICSTTKRVVPLTHYAYLSYPKSFYKNMSNEEATQIQEFIKEPRVLKEQNYSFKELQFNKFKKIHTQANQNYIYTKPSFVLRNIVSYLKEKELLPAICFVFSRKNVEKYANELNLHLIENSNEVEEECLKIVKKLPNYKEYIETPEYVNIVRLLRRGVAIHHSGIIPILREVIEMLFSKGYIKVLFATETFAVGVNMPAKTVIFSNIQKYTEKGFRHLLSHEYTQMAGRAGRRGLDNIGIVIHMLNLFNELPQSYEYRFILDGRPQQLISKFKIHSNLVLRILSNNQSIEEFVKSSMITNEIRKEYKHVERNIEDNKNTIKNLRSSLRFQEKINEYEKMLELLKTAKNKQRKRLHISIETFLRDNPKLEKEYEKHQKIKEIEESTQHLKNNLCNMESYILNTINVIISNLEKNGFVEIDEQQDSQQEIKKYKLTETGMVATQIQELHSLVMAPIILNKKLNNMSATELASFFSIFTSIRVGDDKKMFTANSIVDEYMSSLIKNIEEDYDYFYNEEISNRLDVVDEYTLHYDLIEDVYNWCEANNEQECNVVIQSVKERGIFVGEFVKAILKINNIAKEIEKICNLTNNVELMKKLNEIPKLTMKYIVSTQSLYL